MQMEPGTQQEWNREFIHQETGEPRYIHVTGFINDAQGAKKCIVDLSDRTGEHQTMLAVEAALEVSIFTGRSGPMVSVKLIMKW